MRMTPIRRVDSWGCLAAGLLWSVMGAAPAEGGDFYVGVTGSGERLDVLYDKTVDNTSPSNISLNRGEVFRADDSAVKAAYGYGFLAGYRVPLGLTGVFVGGEFDLAYHGGAVTGRFEGLGTSEGRNQLGEIWPEDWSFDKDRSFGFTLRLGAGIPVVGPGLGPSVYGLVGLRRLKAGFRSDSTGCLNPVPCTEAGEFTSGTDRFDENFIGWTTGGGVEKKLGNIAIRGEVRYTDYGSAGRIIPFEDLGVTVPLSLEASGISMRVGLLWYF